MDNLPLAFRTHDHAHCATDLMAQADALSQTRGLRLTPVRRRTLAVLLEAHRALGAYEVLERLAADGFGRQPPVAYRALEFLVDLGVVHRIDRLNAFAACTQPGPVHSPAFLICRVCDALAETPAPAVGGALGTAAADIGFVVERTTVEAIGLCGPCALAERAS